MKRELEIRDSLVSGSFFTDLVGMGASSRSNCQVSSGFLLSFNGAPHSVQNSIPSLFSVPHILHRMVVSPLCQTDLFLCFYRFHIRPGRVIFVAGYGLISSYSYIVFLFAFQSSDCCGFCTLFGNGHSTALFKIPAGRILNLIS